MARRASKRRRGRDQGRQTNWLLVGGIAAVGVVALLALLILTLQSPAPAVTEEQTSLADYCAANPDNCMAQGSPEAPVTIIEVSDFGCPHCRDYNVETAPLIEERYVESGEVYYVVVPFALSTNTTPAANAGFCAAEQGEYFAFSEAMFNRFDEPDALDREGILTAATQTSLDVDQFTDCLNDARYNTQLRNNIAAATEAGVAATPTFFVNGEKIEGALPFAAFQREIELLLGS